MLCSWRVVWFTVSPERFCHCLISHCVNQLHFNCKLCQRFMIFPVKLLIFIQFKYIQTAHTIPLHTLKQAATLLFKIIPPCSPLHVTLNLDRLSRKNFKSPGPKSFVFWFFLSNTRTNKIKIK